MKLRLAMILGLLVASSFWLLAGSAPVQLDIKVTINSPVTTPVPMNSFATISLTAEDLSSTTITDETQGATPTCTWTITVTPPSGSSYTRTGSGMNYIFREKLTAYGQWKFKAEAKVTCTSGEQAFEGQGTSGEISVMAVAADVIEGPTVVNVGETANYTVSALPSGQTFPAKYPVWSINTQTLNTNFQSSGANASITPTARGYVYIYARCGTRPFILVKIVDGTQNPPPPDFPPGKYDETLGNIDLVAAPGNIRAPGSSQLTATVRDRKGNPVSGVTVTILPAGSPQPGASTDAQGKTTVDVSPLVTTTYFATAPKYGVDSATVSVVPLSSPTIDLKAEKTTISRGESARLTITLKNSNGGLMGGHVQIKVGDVVRAELEVPVTGPSIGIATYDDSPTQTTRYTAVHTANGTSISDSAQVRVIVPENVLSVSDRIWGKTSEDDDDTDNSPATPLAVGPKTLGKDADQLGRITIDLSDPGTAQFPWALHSKATGNPVVPNAQGIFNAATSSVDYDALAPGNHYYVEVTKIGDSAFKRRIDIDAPQVDLQAWNGITKISEATEDTVGIGVSQASTMLKVMPTNIAGYTRTLTWTNPEYVTVKETGNILRQSPIDLASSDTERHFWVTPKADASGNPVPWPNGGVVFSLKVTGSGAEFEDKVTVNPPLRLVVDGLGGTEKRTKGAVVRCNDDFDQGATSRDNQEPLALTKDNDDDLCDASVEFADSPAPGKMTYTWDELTPERLAVWQKSDGNVWVRVSNGQQVQKPMGSPILLKVDGLASSQTIRDINFQADFLDPVGRTMSDSAKLTVVTVRLLADSDNNNGADAPGDTLDEFKQKHDIGKLLWVNRAGVNALGIPGYADFGTGKSNVGKTAKLRCNIAPALPDLQVSLSYPGESALPATISNDLGKGVGNVMFKDYRVAKVGTMRLWRGADRKLENYIAPGAQGDAAAFLSRGDPGAQDFFYVEGVNPNQGDVQLSVKVLDKTLDDKAKLTVVEPKIWLNTSNNTDMRIGVPDKDFKWEDEDEVVKDQGKGFEFWTFSRGASVNSIFLTNDLEDMAPLVTRLPEECRTQAQGLRFAVGRPNFGAAALAVWLVPAVSPKEAPLKYLKDVPTADAQVASINEVADLQGCPMPQPWTWNSDERHMLIGSEDEGTGWYTLQIVDAGNNSITVDSVKVTFKSAGSYISVASARGTPSRPLEVSSEDNRRAPLMAYPKATLVRNNRDAGKTEHLIFVHGFNVDEADAYNAFDEMYKRVFWTGFRGNFVGFLWEGDEGMLNVFHFDDDVVNAFQTAPCLREFLSDTVKKHPSTDSPDGWGVSPDNVNVIAHSLGNLVAWEAWRMQERDYPGAESVRLVNMFTGVEPAVWRDAFDAEEPLTPAPSPLQPIYSVDSLKHHSWSFWFNGNGHPLQGTVVGTVQHTYNLHDFALVAMRLDEWRKRGVDGGWTHYYREPANGLLDYRDQRNLVGRPVLMEDNHWFKALDPIYSWGQLRLPAGTEASPFFDENVNASTHGWRSNKHADFKDLPISTVNAWFEKVIANGAYPIGRE